MYRNSYAMLFGYIFKSEISTNLGKSQGLRNNLKVTKEEGHKIILAAMSAYVHLIPNIL